MGNRCDGLHKSKVVRWVLTVTVLVVISISGAYLSMASETWGLSPETPLAPETFLSRLVGRTMVFLVYAVLQVGIGYEFIRRRNPLKGHTIGAVCIAFILALILNLANPLIQGLFPWTVFVSLFWLVYSAAVFSWRDRDVAERSRSGT